MTTVNIDIYGCWACPACSCDNLALNALQGDKVVCQCCDCEYEVDDITEASDGSETHDVRSSSS